MTWSGHKKQFVSITTVLSKILSLMYSNTLLPYQMSCKFQAILLSKSLQKTYGHWTGQTKHVITYRWNLQNKDGCSMPFKIFCSSCIWIMKLHMNLVRVSIFSLHYIRKSSNLSKLATERKKLGTIIKTKFPRIFIQKMDS